jgi:MYXO-CTERM domain-containing protein
MIETNYGLSFGAYARVLSAFVAVAGISAPAMAQDPEPTTFVDMMVPSLDGWADTNTLSVDVDSQQGRTYIYPNEAAKLADQNGAQDGTGSVAYVIWSLDNKSGRAPGIQTVTNDMDFPVANCIMASGISPDTNEPKTCVDDQGSSKRYKLRVTEADAPIDLVFNTSTAVIRYKGVKDPADDGGEDFEAFRAEFGLGRIYRVIKKWTNESGKRIVGFRLEVGFGIGDEFVPATLDDGVAFELRPLVPREFFVGRTGADDREVWDPFRYAVFSPAMFDDGKRERFEPGFFDTKMAGMSPSETEDGDKSQFIDTGASFDEQRGHRGSLSLNYFGMHRAQGEGKGLRGAPFGYMLPDQLATTGIYMHEDGDPATEGEILAWWDGRNYRYGIDKDFAVVSNDQLAKWAERLLSEDEVLDGPRYESAPMDDLSSLNVDPYIYLDERLLDENGELKHSSITLRVYTVSVAPDTGDGTETPEWMKEGNEAPELGTFAADEDGCGCVSARGSAAPSLGALILFGLGFGGLRRRRAAQGSGARQDRR